MNDRHEGTLRLDSLRREIDQLDLEILELLQRRMALVGQIASLKRQAGVEVQDAAREEAIFQRLARQARTPLSPQAVERIFGEILKVSRELQSRWSD
jgi:monofunctional chorismate mutase